MMQQRQTKPQTQAMPRWAKEAVAQRRLTLARSSRETSILDNLTEFGAMIETLLGEEICNDLLFRYDGERPFSLGREPITVDLGDLTIAHLSRKRLFFWGPLRLSFTFAHGVFVPRTLAAYATQLGGLWAFSRDALGLDPLGHEGLTTFRLEWAAMAADSLTYIQNPDLFHLVPTP